MVDVGQPGGPAESSREQLAVGDPHRFDHAVLGPPPPFPHRLGRRGGRRSEGHRRSGVRMGGAEKNIPNPEAFLNLGLDTRRIERNDIGGDDRQRFGRSLQHQHRRRQPVVHALRDTLTRRISPHREAHRGGDVDPRRTGQQFPGNGACRRNRSAHPQASGDTQDSHPKTTRKQPSSSHLLPPVIMLFTDLEALRPAVYSAPWDEAKTTGSMFQPSTRSTGSVPARSSAANSTLTTRDSPGMRLKKLSSQ
jgi:hypothetical protein